MKTKVCPKCGKRKRLEFFSFRNKGKNTRNSQCKVCHKAYVQDHYTRNKAKYKEKAIVNNKIYQQRSRNFIWEYLCSHACVDCGETNPLVLDFDHLKTKKFEISNATSMAIALPTLIKEINKCAIRCANCHRIKTAKELGWWKDKLGVHQ